MAHPIEESEAVTCFISLLELGNEEERMVQTQVKILSKS